MSETNDLPISPELLAILRDPLAVQQPEKYGEDPGKLELVKGSWLLSADTGLKYPIRDGIPVMLIDEGMRWKDTAVDDLPLPPPAAEPAPTPAAAPAAAPAETVEETEMAKKLLPAFIAGIAAALGGLLWWRRRKQ